MSYMFQRIAPAIFLVVIAASQIYFAIAAFDESGEAARSLHWPSVNGTIDDVDIRRHEHHRTHGRNWVNYEPVVTYEYEIDSQQYRDTRIGWYAIRYSDRDEAQRYLDAHYKNGSTVNVFYDPHHPHHACLIIGHASNEKLRGVMHICIAAAILGLAVFMVFRRKPPSSNSGRRHDHEDALPTEST